MPRIAIIGGGVMGETILAGLIRAGRPARDLVVAEKRPERAEEIRLRHQVAVTVPVEAVADADTIVLAVKPQDLAALLDEIGGHVKPGALAISLAAGITTAFMEQRLPESVACVRVMPNTPALVDEGMAGVSGGSRATEEHLEHAESLMRAVGRVVRVPESQQDAVTAVSGSGPAYVFALVESMVEAGTMLGLPHEIAHELAVQTIVGAGAMLRTTGEHPGVLRDRVTSPGGTTAAALRVLADRGVPAAYLAALEAARDRARELSGGVG